MGLLMRLLQRTRKHTACYLHEGGSRVPVTNPWFGMLVPLATALVLSMTCQSPSTDRDLAEQLARSGRTVEALALFEQIVAENPTDVEVRLWIARLQLRIGRTEEAEAGFRAVLLEHPSDVDARIGLGAALTRRDAWREALDDPARRGTGRRRERRPVRALSPAPTGAPATTAAPSSTTSGPRRSRRAIRTWSMGTKPRCERTAHRSRSKDSPREG